MPQTLIFGIKRCEESRRTLKNPFASRLAEFRTTLKLLRITDQWYIVPVKFRFGRNQDFWRYFYCRWPEDQRMGSALMPIEGLFLLPASIQAQIIVKGIRRNETATIKTVRKKPLRHWCDWGDLVKQEPIWNGGKLVCLLAWQFASLTWHDRPKAELLVQTDTFSL